MVQEQLHAFAVISNVAHGKRNGKLDRISDETLAGVVHFLVHVKPRELSILDNRKPIVIFTDASYEAGIAKYGIVAFLGSDACS